MKSSKSIAKLAFSLILVGALLTVLSSCSRRTGCPGAITKVDVKDHNPS